MLTTRNSYRCVLRDTHTTVVKTERKSVVVNNQTLRLP